jgi:SAM-dependent methyltransferase
LSLNLASHELYPAIVSALRTGDYNFLDAGCCLGQELRKLAFDNVPPQVLYGLDLEAPFIEIGYQLFQDREKMAGATFLAGDLLAEDSSQESWTQLTGKMDFVFANSLLHLFAYPDQLKIACRLASFTRDRPGSLIIGRQVGSLVPGELPGLDAVSTSFRHSPESFDELWKEVGRLTGTRWRLQARLDMKDIVDHTTTGQGWMDENSRRLHFVLERLKSNHLPL